MPHRRWEDLPDPVLHAVESHTGRVRSVDPVAAGSVSDIAATLSTDVGKIFCKAIETASPLAGMHRNEARLNEWLPDLVPRLRWTVEESGWLVLGFDHVAGRHPDLSVGSADLPIVAATLTSLSRSLTPCPPVRVQPATARWAEWIDPELIDGDSLVHTDVTPQNFLLTAESRMHVVDWSMPCRGAAWIDTAFMIVRLIRAGHSPEQAESWAEQIPAWSHAPDRSVTTFAGAIADLWRQRLRDAPAPHRGPLALAASDWASYRMRAFSECRTTTASRI